MDFQPWPKPGFGRGRRCCRTHEPDVEVDLDQWVEMANGAVDGPLVDMGSIGRDRPSIDAMTEQLVAAISDDAASMVPPTAADLSVAEWRRLTPHQRTRLAQRHLATLDPRLLPRAVLRWSERRLRQPHR